MSGMFFVNPGVRFSRRNRVCQSRVPSVLFRRLIDDADRRCLRLGSRVYEAEFPLARLIVYRVLLFIRSGPIPGARARDRASTDALRPFNNWVKPEDQYGILSIGEKRPAFARHTRCVAAARKVLPAARHPKTTKRVNRTTHSGMRVAGRSAHWASRGRADGSPDGPAARAA